jgi:SAM-dependent methyltransferase
MTDLNAVKAQQQGAWSLGDFSMIGWSTVYPGELMCEAAQLKAGQKVLDVACGSGNVALSAARRNCEAMGVDYVPALIERARARAAAERLPARFELGDCEAIPCPDGTFDAVLSVYGSIFAPRQEVAAQELIRVTKPGGKIGMANWTPEGFWGQSFGLIAQYIPPPEGLRSPVQWGTEQRLHELFGDAVFGMHIEKRSALFRFRSSAHWIEVFRTYFGPIIRALDVLGPQRGQTYLADLDALLRKFNRSDDDTLVLSADYLEVIMTRK